MGSTLLSLRMIVVRSRLGILAELGHPDYTTSIYSITCRSRYLTLTLTPKILKWHGSLGRRYYDIGFQLSIAMKLGSICFLGYAQSRVVRNALLLAHRKLNAHTFSVFLQTLGALYTKLNYDYCIILQAWCWVCVGFTCPARFDMMAAQSLLSRPRP